MSTLANRVTKLESKLGTEEEKSFILHTVSWDEPDDDERGEPIGYLLDGKIYPNVII